MDGTEDADVYPLTAEQRRRKRIKEEKDSILNALNGIEFERRELTSDLRKHQNIYLRKLTHTNNQVQKLISKQQALLRRVSDLMKLVD